MFHRCRYSLKLLRNVCCGGKYSKQQYSDHFVFADLIGKFGTPVSEELTKDNYSVKETFCEDLCDNSDIDFDLICATRYIFNPNNKYEQQKQQQGNAANVVVEVASDNNETSNGVHVNGEVDDERVGEEVEGVQ